MSNEELEKLQLDMKVQQAFLMAIAEQKEKEEQRKKEAAIKAKEAAEKRREKKRLEEEHRREIEAMSVEEVRERFHAALRKYGINYKKGNDQND